MSCGKTFVTPEMKALIGMEGELAEASWWIVEQEGLRRFTQAVMDADPRFFDEEFAKTTKFGGVVTPPIYCTYMGKRPPWVEDPIHRTFAENPVADGLAGAEGRRRRSLPPMPRSTELVRHLNAGNEEEILKYPSLGDRIYSKPKHANVIERMGRDGSHMLISTSENIFYNQKGEVLCITRGSGISR